MVGTYQDLEIVKMLPFGAIVGEQEILLPTKYIPSGVGLGDRVSVFIYTDSQDRLIATTLKPYGELGEIVCLEVVDVVLNGAYLDIGLPKDIFMPSKKRYKKGDKVAVQICLDKQSRLIASENLRFYPYKGNHKNKEVQIVPYHQSPLGFMCIVDKRYSGMIYHNEIFSKIVLGEKIGAKIKNVRQDGKLDLKIFQGDETQRVLDLLKQNNGRIPINSDCTPQEIYEFSQMSKKAFKRALSSLAQRVGQDERGSYLSPAPKNKE